MDKEQITIKKCSEETTYYEKNLIYDSHDGFTAKEIKVFFYLQKNYQINTNLCYISLVIAWTYVAETLIENYNYCCSWQV